VIVCVQLSILSRSVCTLFDLTITIVAIAILLRSLRNYAEKRGIPQILYVPAQSYQVRRRVCYIPAKATAQLAVPAHLVLREPTLLSCRDDVCILASKTLIGESACLDGGRRLDCDSVQRQRHIMPHRRQIVMREDPGAEVGDNGIRVRGEFGGVDMEDIYSCRDQAFGL
jgi:hypothetical protein